MTVNKLIENDASNLPLQWLIYSSIYDAADSWDYDFSDGYQIVAEIEVRQDADPATIGACVEALGTDGT